MTREEQVSELLKMRERHQKVLKYVVFLHDNSAEHSLAVDALFKLDNYFLREMQELLK